MPDKDERYKSLKALAWVTQFGLSMVSPLILCIIAAKWLSEHFGWGSRVMVVAILLGVGSSCMTFVSYMKTVKKENGGGHDDKKDADGGSLGDGR